MNIQQDDVLGSITHVLDRSDWDHLCLPNSCFDVLGTGTEQTALFKAHVNVDSVTADGAAELKRAAAYLSAAPLIVGERNSRGELEKQVIYERYGIPTIKPETLEAYLELQEPACVMNRKGGYYVALDADRIEEQREEQGLSRNALAKEVGITARTLVTYRERGRATVETAERLQEVLGDVVSGIDIFASTPVDEAQHGVENRITYHLTRIGLDAAGFHRAPFDVAARDDEDTFVARRDVEGDDAVMDWLRAAQRLVKSNPFLVAEQEMPEDGIAVVTEERLREIKSKADLKAEVQRD